MRRDFIYLSIIAVLAYLAFYNNSAIKSHSLAADDSYPRSTNFRTLESKHAKHKAKNQTQAETAKKIPFTMVDADPDEDKDKPNDGYFWMCLCVSILLVLFGGAMSGLTVGYLSIDELQLELKMQNGTDEEKKDAAIISSILSKHHLLLSTLLLANAFAMEALPIFLDAIMPAFAAIIVSTSAVVVFGEIIPQAYCTGPNQLKIARRMAPLIKFLMYALFIICYPISIILDKLLGTHHKTRFVKKDLKTLISLHHEGSRVSRGASLEGSPVKNPDTGSDPEEDEGALLTQDEIKVINSTIDLRDTPVTKEMESIERVFMISYGETIDQELLRKICKAGFSKVPVYRNGDRNQVLGFIRVKTLLEFDKYDGKSLAEAEVHLKRPLIVAKDTSMLEMMMLFQEQRTAVALVSDETIKDKDKDASAFTYSRELLASETAYVKLAGLVSLKDIFEEILETKMLDDDVHQHNPNHHHIPFLRSGSNKFKKRQGEGINSSPRSRSKSPSPSASSKKQEEPPSPRWSPRTPTHKRTKKQKEISMVPGNSLTQRLLEP